MSEQCYFSPTKVSVSKVRYIQAEAITGAQSERRGNEIYNGFVWTMVCTKTKQNKYTPPPSTGSLGIRQQQTDTG